MERPTRTQWRNQAAGHTERPGPSEYETVLEELAELESRRSTAHTQTESAAAQEKIMQIWEWLQQEEVRAQIAADALQQVLRREPGGPGMWAEEHLVAVQQRKWCTGLLIPYWVAHRGTQWLCKAPLAVALLVEYEQPGSVDAATLEGVPRAQLEMAVQLWKDGGAHSQVDEVLVLAELLGAQ